MKGAHFVNGMHRVELCIQTTLCCICLATVSGSPNPFYSMSVVSSIFAGHEELPMTVQELHEAGLHEGLMNIALYVEAFKTHAWRLRKSSVSSLSHISYNQVTNASNDFLKQ